MKLHHYTFRYLSIALLIILSVWAVIFYINMLDEIYDSIDDGLDNYKILIIQQAREDSIVLHKTSFNESNYSIREITKELALSVRDTHRDTLMYMQNEDDYEPVRILTTAFESNGRYYELKVISSMVEEDDLMEDLFIALLWLYIILLIVILLVNTLLLKKIWKPFYSILHQLKTFRLGKDPIIQEASMPIKEFEELNNALTGLLKRNLETFNNQKQFTENAAHELQTPLAIAINKLELLAEKNQLNNEQANSIGEVIQLLERLTQLNKSLLLLSKIENKQFLENEEVSFNKVCQHTIEAFEDLAEFKQVKIELSGNESLTCSMNPYLASILVSNLIKNAIVHNTTPGYVKVLLNTSSLSICNSGPDISLEPDKIFNRFAKGDSNQNGTGLGLSIAKAISDLYGFSLNYTYNKEHCFTLTLRKQ